ncbi:Serine/threonine phosphatase stp [Nymphon striatum]|nr:Serine/threonine phosphatase stp [Nymphon striatum]
MATAKKNQTLPVGYKLQDYVIRQVLSTGGFSLVYLAEDKNKQTVAIKEYMPTSLALREDGATVMLDNEDDSATFKHGLKCFFEEGLALANIDHKNIVRVTNFFRENNTVYMVMQYERGKSLQEYILSQEEPVNEKFVRRVFGELLNGLREVHLQKMLHLDIKPANLYIRLDGSPVLLDFGSARQTLTLSQSKLSPSYTPGFAPPEQYFDRKQLGPWSDIYSVGASMYSCLARSAPIAANQRVKKDFLAPATNVGKGIYSEELLTIIDNCLQLDYLDRPQSPRDYNQDRLAYSYSKDSLLLVLADGMGGHRHGEVAAQLAIKTLTDAFQRLAKPLLNNPAKFLTDHIQQVHDMIENVTQSESLAESPRTTVVVAVIQRGYLYCAHVGDSRLYHFRGNHLLYRTEDHSIVQSLYNKGMIGKEEMATHPYRNKIYNCVGGEVPPQIDLSDRIELVEGDTILLCTDGLWGVLDDAKIKATLNQNIDVTLGTKALMDEAEQAADEHGDNLSAIALQWGDKQLSDDTVSTQLMPLGDTTTIINPVTQQKVDGSDPQDLSDDDIESTIAEIQAALNKTKQKN